MLEQLMRGGILSNISPRFKYGRIATEDEAREIGGSGFAVIDRCCTKARAYDLGCGVRGSYANNQLVEKDSLFKNTPVTPTSNFTFKFINGASVTFSGSVSYNVWGSDQLGHVPSTLLGNATKQAFTCAFNNEASFSVSIPVNIIKVSFEVTFYESNGSVAKGDGTGYLNGASTTSTSFSWSSSDRFVYSFNYAPI